MKSKLPVIILSIVLIIFCKSAIALQIVYPKEGQIFYAGDEFEVIVKADPGEEWEGVIYGISLMNYKPLSKEYTVQVRVPKDLSGTQEIYVIGVEKATGKEVKVKRTLFVKLPPNVVLQGIEVNPNPLFLEKLPPDSAPDDIRVFGTRDLKVQGVYSDGVKRKLGASASGTTYTSSNNQVVTVDTEGKAVAQGIGKAKITVRNGNISADVRVIVDSYKE